MIEQESYLLGIYPAGPAVTNSYLLGCTSTKEAIIIDPSYNSTETITKAITDNNLTLKAIWLTHSHWDHIADCSMLQRKYQDRSIELHVHFLDKENVLSPGSDGLPIPINITPSTPSHLFREQDTIICGNLKGTILHTPGHSPGSSCFLFPELFLLFSGDTLFKGSYGNISFPTSSPHAMRDSLKRIGTLNFDDLTIYPGHGAATSLKQERTWLSRFL